MKALRRLGASPEHADLRRAEDPIFAICGVHSDEILRRCGERRGRIGWRLIDFADLSDERFVQEVHLVLLARLPSAIETKRRITDLSQRSSRFEIVVRLGLSPEGRILRDRPLAGVVLPAVALAGRGLHRTLELRGIGPLARRLERSARRRVTQQGARP